MMVKAPHMMITLRIMAKAPHTMVKAPHTISKSPHTMAKAPYKITNAPHEMLSLKTVVAFHTCLYIMQYVGNDLPFVVKVLVKLKMWKLSSCFFKN